jgi:D-arabinose 1-dehydrogenase-like Zn-dependent alcohol dehydrogenase
VVEAAGGPRRARPGPVIVRPEAVGSGFHLFSGDVAALSGAGGFYPRVQGHEIAAIVADPGDSARETNTPVAIGPRPRPQRPCPPRRAGASSPASRRWGSAPS